MTLGKAELGVWVEDGGSEQDVKVSWAASARVVRLVDYLQVLG